MMSIFTSFIRKSSEALQSKTRNEQRLSRVTLNLGMFSEVMRNRFAKDTHLLHVESVLSLALLVDCRVLKPERLQDKSLPIDK